MSDPKLENQKKNIGFFKRVKQQFKGQGQAEPKLESIHPSEAEEIVLTESELAQLDRSNPASWE
jgi:hypothetical protein